MSTRTTGTPYFLVRGSRNGSLVTLRWSPEELGGDPPTVDLVLAELEIASTGAENRDDVHQDAGLTAILARAGGHPLDDPEAVYALAERVLDAIRDVQAEPPNLAARLRQRRAATHAPTPRSDSPTPHEEEPAEDAY
jgi:hypothetical protein